MKHLTISIQNIKIKGNPEDPETLQVDLYEKIQAMIEAETLKFDILEDEDDGDEDYL
jgi:hypothetical protein